jgi:UDP-2,3-diacylglucosamine pyrophosphatase LpxH
MYKSIGFVILALIVVSFLLTLLFFPLIREIFPGTPFLIPFFAFFGVLAAIGLLWFLLVDFRATLAAVWFPIGSLLLYIFKNKKNPKKKKYSEMLEFVITGYLYKRLLRLFDASSDQNVVKDPDKRKYILFSDCHRGDGSWADDFAPNENIYFNALSYYYQNGYTYIEIGDGDELWENNYIKVTQQHSNIFWLLDKFHKEQRFFMIWGNHDRDKIKHGLVHNHTDQKTNKLEKRLEGAEVFESVVLKLMDDKKKINIFLVHGHQVDYFNGLYFSIGKFATRKIWKPLQQMGVADTTSAAQNFVKRNIIDSRLIEWTHNKKDLIIIAGHNHHPSLKTNPLDPYFNTGSCVHPRCITGIEITREKEGWQADLVKWHITVENEGELNGDDNKANKRKPAKRKSAAEPCQKLVVCRSSMIVKPILLKNAIRH